MCTNKIDCLTVNRRSENDMNFSILFSFLIAFTSFCCWNIYLFCRLFFLLLSLSLRSLLMFSAVWRSPRNEENKTSFSSLSFVNKYLTKSFIFSFFHFIFPKTNFQCCFFVSHTCVFNFQVSILIKYIFFHRKFLSCSELSPEEQEKFSEK